MEREWEIEWERERETGMKEEKNIKNLDQLVDYLPQKHWSKEFTCRILLNGEKVAKLH